MVVKARDDAQWSVNLVHPQTASGQRYPAINVIGNRAQRAANSTLPCKAAAVGWQGITKDDRRGTVLARCSTTACGPNLSTRPRFTTSITIVGAHCRDVDENDPRPQSMLDELTPRALARNQKRDARAPADGAHAGGARCALTHRPPANPSAPKTRRFFVQPQRRNGRACLGHEGKWRGAEGEVRMLGVSGKRPFLGHCPSQRR